MKKKPAPKKSEFLSIRISLTTKNKLLKIAEEQERSISWLVGKIVEDYLKKKKET